MRTKIARGQRSSTGDALFEPQKDPPRTPQSQCCFTVIRLIRNIVIVGLQGRLRALSDQEKDGRARRCGAAWIPVRAQSGPVR